MKKALIIFIAAIGLVAWIFFSFRNEAAVATSAAQQWPGRMGTLEAVADRWPRLEPNDASVKLTSLAKMLSKNDALDDFVAREIARSELTIGEPPALPSQLSASSCCASQSSGSATTKLATHAPLLRVLCK